MKRRDVVLGGSALIGASMVGSARAQAASIKFGQSASLSGAQAGYGKDVRDGILAAFNAANKADGRGPRFELETLDDGGEKSAARSTSRS